MQQIPSAVLESSSDILRKRFETRTVHGISLLRLAFLPLRRS